MIFEQIVTLLGTLILIGLILVASYWCTKRLGTLTNIRHQSKYIKIVDQLVLGQNKSMVITKIGEKYFLISLVTDRIEILTELREEDLIEYEKNQTPIPALDFREVLKRIKSGKEDK